MSNYGVISEHGSLNFHVLADGTVAIQMADIRVGTSCMLRIQQADLLAHLRGALEALTPKEVYREAPAPAETPPEPRVGYGNPPVETRFKPGHSGNPKGRPRVNR